MTDYILTEDLSSGRIHKRFRADAGYATHEADNLDQAGAYRILTDTRAIGISQERWCKRCFPNGPELHDVEQDTDSGPDAEDDPEVAQEDPVA